MLEAVVEQEINHVVQGKKVLAGEKEDNRSRALAMCRDSIIGYDTLTGMKISQEYVGAAKEFYDSLTKTFVVKADSDISTFDKIKCSGSFELQLP